MLRLGPSATLLPGRARLIPNLHEKCGVMGIFAPGEDVARLAFFGLHSLQHRGQESAGIATADIGAPDAQIHRFAEMGLVTQIFHEEVLQGLGGGTHAIGHTRYSTTGSSHELNMQPLVVSGPHGDLALAHNGNVVNADVLRADLEERGIEFATGTDSEVLAQMIAHAPGGTWEERFTYAMRRANGAYSLTVLTRDALFGVRDPLGIRPLCLGRLDAGWVLASETCALDTLGAELVRELAPGEVVRIDEDGAAVVVVGCGAGRRAHVGAVPAGAHLLRAARLAAAGRAALRGADADGRAAGARAPGRGGHRDRHPRLGDGGGRGLRAGVGRPLRGGPGQEPLRRADLHPARPAAARARGPS